MKKVTMILTLVAGLGIMTSQVIQAVQPMHHSGLNNNDNSVIELEKEIELQDWMLSPASFSKKGNESEQILIVQDWMLSPASFSEKGNEIEQELIVQSWMLDADWGQENTRFVSESEIELKDWMLNTIEFSNSDIALEDWMLRIIG
jgi:hypothetical protein